MATFVWSSEAEATWSLAPPLPRASARILFLFLVIEAIPESIGPAVVSIWIVIRPVVGPVVVGSISISISVSPVIGSPVIGLIIGSPVIGLIIGSPVIGLIRIAVIPAVAVTTPLRHVTVYAALRVREGSKRRRYRKREDAH
jgi:hypothetical protein